MVKSIPKSAAEKVQRWRLTEQFTQQPDSEQQHVRDAQDVMQEVQQAWEEELGRPPSHDHDNFFKSGGGSMQAAALAINLSSRLSFPVDTAMVFSRPGPERLAAAIQQQMAEACSNVRMWHSSSTQLAALIAWQPLHLASALFLALPFNWASDKHMRHAKYASMALLS